MKFHNRVCGVSKKRSGRRMTLSGLLITSLGIVVIFTYGIICFEFPFLVFLCGADGNGLISPHIFQKNKLI